jgi:lipopolysaccharide export system permease protein
MSLIGRLILWDLLKITTLTLSGISILFVMGGAAVEINRFGVDPVKVLTMIPLLIPPTLPYTIPVSLLLACTFVYSRLSSNQEIAALKAGGIHVMRIVAPALLVGSLLTGLSVVLVDRLIPACQAQIKRIIMNDLKSNLYAYIRQQGGLYRAEFPYEIYVERIQDDRLLHATFKHRTASGKYDFVAQADEATLNVVQAAGGTLPEEPKVHLRLMNHVVVSDEGRGHFYDQTYQMPIPDDLAKRDFQHKMLTCVGCWSEANHYLDEADLAHFDLAALATASLLQGDPIPVAQLINDNQVHAQRMERKSREMHADIHSRLAQAASALFFVLVGCPMGIIFQRRDFMQTFFVCFLPIITLYYPALILAQNVVKEGLVPAYVSIWAPTAAMGLLSIPLLRRVIKY